MTTLAPSAEEQEAREAAWRAALALLDACQHHRGEPPVQVGDGAAPRPARTEGRENG